MIESLQEHYLAKEDKADFGPITEQRLNAVMESENYNKFFLHFTYNWQETNSGINSTNSLPPVIKKPRAKNSSIPTQISEFKLIKRSINPTDLNSNYNELEKQKLKLMRNRKLIEHLNEGFIIKDNSQSAFSQQTFTKLNVTKKILEQKIGDITQKERFASITRPTKNRSMVGQISQNDITQQASMILPQLNSRKKS